MEKTLTKLKVDLDAIAYNYNQIKSRVGKDVDVVGVIKANAYGAGSVMIARTLTKEGAKTLAVADTNEATELREAGIIEKIILLYQASEKEVNAIIDYDLTPTVSDIDFAEKLNQVAKEKSKVVNVHVEIDTGTGRLGINPIEALNFINNLKLFSNINVEGISMHYAASDSEEPNFIEFSRKQTKSFKDVISELENNDTTIKYKHAACGGAILNYPEAYYNMIRPGLILYGYYPNECFSKMIELKPSMSLTSEIVFIKEVSEGTPIGYNGTFSTNRKSVIATVAIGYSDGLKRALSNKGYMIVKNKKAPIVGRICMDTTMIDITDIPDVKVGDEATVFDNNLIKVDEVAELCDTISYEIICTINERVQREYIKSGN